MMKKLSSIVKRFFTPELKALYKAGFINGDNELTDLGSEQLEAIVVEKHMDELVTAANDYISDKKKKKRTTIKTKTKTKINMAFSDSTNSQIGTITTQYLSGDGNFFGAQGGGGAGGNGYQMYTTNSYGPIMYQTTTTDPYWQQMIPTNGMIQVQGAMTWSDWNMDVFKKRRRFLGKNEDGKTKAEFFFKVLKKGLKKYEWKKFRDDAEKAFEEAVKHEGLGQDNVAKKLEKIMNQKLKLSAIGISGYDKYVDDKMIEEYRKYLPKMTMTKDGKELIIDDLTEYDKPLPEHAQKKLAVAKKAKVFDSFCVFWIKEVKDPILFGQITEQPDVFYYIDEWDSDISIEDLLKYK
jgi:hypothetical protein